MKPQLKVLVMLTAILFALAVCAVLNPILWMFGAGIVILAIVWLVWVYLQS